MRIRSIAQLGACLLLAAAVRMEAEQGVRRYVETHGQRRALMQYAVMPTADGIEISSVGGGTEERVRWVAGTGTVSWTQSDPGAGTALLATRTGDTIRVTGKLKGRSVVRELRVNAAPWYQVFGPAIDQLLPEGSAQQEFWVVNPADLSAHKMQARRGGTESIEVQGMSVAAVRIHFSPAGALAPFWGADFWYRVSDGAWVYSRLPEDGGLTVTTIEDPSG